MGGYYARHDGEGEAVALAIEDHYRPRFAGDALPRGAAALVLALADKLETLVGMFGIGQKPTGDKDPFALRRHALGVIRMLIERALPLEPAALVGAGLRRLRRDARPGARGSCSASCCERLVGYLRERGLSARRTSRRCVERAAARAGPSAAAARRGARLRGAARGRRRWPRPTSGSATS